MFFRRLLNMQVLTLTKSVIFLFKCSNVGTKNYQHLRVTTTSLNVLPKRWNNMKNTEQ